MSHVSTSSLEFDANLNFLSHYMILGGTSVSEDNKELNQLHSAERDSNVTEMKLTLPPGFSVDSRNATGRTPLMNAALNGNVRAVKSIMKRGADPSLMERMEHVTSCRSWRRH